MSLTSPAADLAVTMVHTGHHIAQDQINRGIREISLQSLCCTSSHALLHQAGFHASCRWHALLLQGRFAEGLASCINNRLGPHEEQLATDAPDMAAIPSVQEHQVCCSCVCAALQSVGTVCPPWTGRRCWQ